MLAQGSVQEIRALLDKYPHRIWILPRDPKHVRKLGQMFLREKSVESVTIQEQPKGVIVHTKVPNEFYKELPQILVKKGIKVDHISSPDDSLEVLYSLLMGGYA